MYLLDFSDEIKEKVNKLAPNKNQKEAISKKIKQILVMPYHFKPLRGDMHNRRRVHVNTSFVIVYKIIEDIKTIKIVNYEHHDKVY